MKHFLFFTRILYFVCYDKIDNISESKILTESSKSPAGGGTNIRLTRTNAKYLLAF